MKKKNSAIARGKYVCRSILAFGVFLATSLQLGLYVSDGKIECWVPDYEQIEIEAILGRERFTDSDYEILFAQTGLTPPAIDRAKKYGDEGVRRILEIQEHYFTNHEIKHKLFGPWTCTDYIEGRVRNIFLEKGDIVLTSSTHVSSCRIGHAGLVVDDAREEVLQALTYGALSSVGSVRDFLNRVNFMILRPKVDPEIRERVAQYAKEKLVGIPYSGFAGIFTNQTALMKTQCAHLIWRAYHEYGVELGGGKRAPILPYDIAISENLELVQTFGFPPDTLWNKLFD